MIPETVIARHGSLSVLNVMAGELKFSFDPAHPEEVARTKDIIASLLKKGHMIFVQVDGKTERVKEFDPNTSEYIVGDKEKKPPRRVSTRRPAHSVAPTSGG